MNAAPFPATRAEALARLAEFIPDAGRAYATHRNDDRGPGHHGDVSRLSAALRRRLVSEAEVIAAILTRHTVREAERFIGEIFWRSYFKGWLEHHPSIWSAWRGDVLRLTLEWAGRSALRDAQQGRTGIDCFDHWIGELRATGYLHNWARMQLASIWIFTLGLPWQLGADLTFRHFIDADPASNTLSWRWVGGLHTSGKTYLADPDRIARRTGGRFRPRGLATSAMPQAGTANPPATPPRRPRPPEPNRPASLLLTGEDLSLELERPDLDVRRVLVVPGADDGRPAAVVARRALADAADRAAAHWRCPIEAVALTDLDERLGDGEPLQIVGAYTPVGPGTDALADSRLAPAEHLRRWDEHAWPHASRGYFQLRERILGLLAGAGLVHRPGAPGSE